MIATTLLRAPDQGAPGPAADLAACLEQVAALRRENAALRAENAVLQERVRELEARLGQNSTNSSRPPRLIHPRPRRARRRRPPDGSGAASPDTGGPVAGCCRSSRWTRLWSWCQSSVGIVSSLLS